MASKEENKQAIASLVKLVITPWCIFVDAFVLHKLLLWFVPWVPDLSLWQIAGISLIGSYWVVTSFPPDVKKYTSEEMAKQITGTLYIPWAVLFFGWILHCGMK